MAYQVTLAKERFKFSATHFTIFSDHEAESLHGHNYHVSVDLDFSQLGEDTGLTAEFSKVKYKIDKVCESLDEKVLLPDQSPYLIIDETDTNYEVRFSGKFYSFPKEDCAVLDVVNISSECLSRYVYDELAKDIQTIGLQSFSVTIEESDGQSVTYINDFDYDDED